MFQKKYTSYLLFFIAYIGALLIEKPTYSGRSVTACFIFLLTISIHFSIFCLLILGNSKLLIPYLLEKRRFGLYVSGILGLILVYTVFNNHGNDILGNKLFKGQYINTNAGFWDNFIYALCCTVIASMLYITQKWSEQQDQVKNIQINQLETELKYLRLQINPHFLFNGLNTVYGHIDINNREARSIMVQFSDLLRYNLYEADVDFIGLEKEVKYLQNYVALQKARSNDNMEVTLKIDHKNGNTQVAPLIFMAFVENAFKYASRGDNRLNTINIALTEYDGKIDFSCDNSFDEEEPAPGGIGLNNVVRRLELLYKNRYQLDIKKDNGIFHVHLTLSV